MSGRRSKQLRRRAEDLLIEWLRTMVPDGEDTSKTPEEKFPVEKEEDRVDAANVLLGLMKRN